MKIGLFCENHIFCHNDFTKSKKIFTKNCSEYRKVEFKQKLFKVVCIQEHVFQLNNFHDFHNLNNFQTKTGLKIHFELFLVHFESISQSILAYLHTS